CQHGYGIPYTF
nr:immunoglobulin light chain junction region [Macaca mulatta]